MIEIEIPGCGTLRLKHLVLDVNGTIAKDGQLIDGVADLLQSLRATIDVHLVTADTHGKQEAINDALQIQATIIPRQNQSRAKADFIGALDRSSVVAMGNGANDALMLESAALGVCIIGPEGCATETLSKSDVVVPHIHAGLELLLHPKRLIATLRR
jgi:P-type E1-E2 ATPase